MLCHARSALWGSWRATLIPKATAGCFRVLSYTRVAQRGDEQNTPVTIRTSDYRNDGKISKMGNLIDRVRITCKGGSGGQGIPRTGATGGDGGSVIVEGSSMPCLRHIVRNRTSTLFKADSGENAAQRRRGLHAKDLVLKVPCGTVILSEYGHVINEVNEAGQRVTVAYGGEGGSAMTNQRWNGLKGDALQVALELKTIADVGLVGFPNAGKSSLLAALSRAKPKISDYPFTTLRPNIGAVIFDDLGTAKMADIPGLIEGASENYGMGHSFLRHIERTRLLLYVVDLSGFQLSSRLPYQDAVEAVRLLARELELYHPGLATKPSLLAVNKLDVDGAPELYAKFRKELPAVVRETNMNLKVVVPISVKAGFGLDQLKHHMQGLLKENFAEAKKDFVENLLTPTDTD